MFFAFCAVLVFEAAVAFFVFVDSVFASFVCVGYRCVLGVRVIMVVLVSIVAIVL